jgi:hypothetical protein
MEIVGLEPPAAKRRPMISGPREAAPASFFSVSWERNQGL